MRESAIITSTRDGFWELWGIPHDCSWEQHVLSNVVEVVWKICNNASGRVSVIGVAIIIIGKGDLLPGSFCLSRSASDGESPKGAEE